MDKDSHFPTDELGKANMDHSNRNIYLDLMKKMLSGSNSLWTLSDTLPIIEFYKIFLYILK